MVAGVHAHRSDIVMATPLIKITLILTCKYSFLIAELFYNAKRKSENMYEF